MRWQWRRRVRIGLFRKLAGKYSVGSIASGWAAQGAIGAYALQTWLLTERWDEQSVLVLK
jgi:hypothetical protein